MKRKQFVVGAKCADGRLVLHCSSFLTIKAAKKLVDESEVIGLRIFKLVEVKG